MEQGKSSNWTPVQSYVLATICLIVGFALGFLVRGSSSPKAAPAQAAATQQAPAGMGGMGMGGQPTPEQLKHMADKQAEPILEQLKAKPNDPALLAQAGNVYYDAQQFPTAVDYYKKSLQVNPKEANVLTDLGTAYLYMGQTDDAMQQFDAALKVEPNRPTTLYNRGILKWRAKMDIQGALADWETLLKTNPNYQERDKVEQMIAQAKKHMNMKPGAKTDKPAM